MEELKYPFWVVEVNNFICAVGYENGKEFKAMYPAPTFRRFWFIRKESDLDGFSKREPFGSNVQLVKYLLKQNDPSRKINRA
jgi:hypothetical protein